MLLYQTIICLVVFLFGINIGSFLNVCIYRLPKEESIIKGSSHCMKCNSKIRWFDLIPIFSWLNLKGKCRKCDDKIGVRYLLVELLTGIVWVLCFIVSGLDTNMLAGLISSLLMSALIVIFFMDMDTQLISVGVVIFIALLAVPQILFISDLGVKSHIIGFFVISVPLLVLNLLSKGRAMGMGDVYLMAAAGLYLGTKEIVVAMFFGLILGSIGGIIIKRSSGNSQFAFGPFLALGIGLSSFLGTPLADWYISFISLK